MHAGEFLRRRIEDRREDSFTNNTRRNQNSWATRHDAVHSSSHQWMMSVIIGASLFLRRDRDARARSTKESLPRWHQPYLTADAGWGSPHDTTAPARVASHEVGTTGRRLYNGYCLTYVARMLYMVMPNQRGCSAARRRYAVWVAR